MPLIIDGGRVPTRWAEKGLPRPVSSEGRSRYGDCLRLALINNMPDAALEDTELQFFELLDAASGDTPVVIKLYSLTGVPRAERGQRHLNSFYFPFDDLWQHKFDGAIITGTEPRYPTLQEEPYWGLMTEVFEWAERNTSSTILSCLAAHASVFHADGVKRHPLPDKMFGVFDSIKKSKHALTKSVTERIRFPHSRWNEVRAEELTAAGYSVLTHSKEAGVDLFVKKRKDSLFVHFQGHPEYGSQTLLKEYRRDIKRFLRGERETYPTMPAGYFNSAADHLLGSFRKLALSDRREDIMNKFPDSQIVGELQDNWRPAANQIYGSWLNYLCSARGDWRSSFALPQVEKPHLYLRGGEIA